MKKFFCGHKKQFGLNMQGTCDADGQFLDVSICHPAGVTSYFLAFSTSPLVKHWLETQDSLANAMVSVSYLNNEQYYAPQLPS
jgi:hypothetical protein